MWWDSCLVKIRTPASSALWLLWGRGWHSRRLRVKDRVARVRGTAGGDAKLTALRK